MKIPFLKSKPAKGDGDSTATPSSNQSQIEKDALQASSRSPSPHSLNEGEKVVEETPVGEAKALDKLDDENEYPSGAKLAIITASLCLSVFLMALVSLVRQYASEAQISNSQ